MSKPHVNRQQPEANRALTLVERGAEPAELTVSSRQLFDKLVHAYGIDDIGGREILRCGLVSLDRAEAAERTIARDGLSFVDKAGQPKAHPLLPVARDARAAWLTALKALNLAVGEPARPGRPPGTGQGPGRLP